MPHLEQHVSLNALWLPILLSAVGVWFASFLIWAISPLHKKDWKGLPDENAFAAAIKGLAIPPGNYGFPHAADNKACRDPEFKKKWTEGPAGMLSVWPTKTAMGPKMLLTFIVYILMGVFIAYIGSLALMPGADQKSVFRLVGAAGILGYCFSFLPNAIWFNHTPRAIVQCVIDGVIYGLITAAVFAFMWPGK
jgi:hypothetical protein